MIVLFFLGQPVEKVAIVGGAFLLLTRRVILAKSTGRSIGRYWSCSGDYSSSLPALRRLW